MNSVVLTGRLATTPKLEQTKSGRSTARLRMATDEPYFDGKGKRREETQWHTVRVFDELAEVCCANLEAGQQVEVLGSYRSYQLEISKGQEVSIYYVRAREINFGAKPKNR